MTEPTAPPSNELPIAAGEAQAATLAALERLREAFVALEAVVMALARAVDATAGPKAGGGA